jgi:hypothetical protein
VHGPSEKCSESFELESIWFKKIGRPKLIWENGVLQDIRALDIKSWRDSCDKGGMANIAVEGQGPPWAVEPVMMMKFYIPENDKSNIRLISMTSGMCKLLERKINVRISWWLAKNKKFSETQYGFRRNKG